MQSNNDTFDSKILHLRQQRAANAFAGSGDKAPDFLLQLVADDIALRLQTVNRTFDNAIDLLGRSGKIAAALKQLKNIKNVQRLEASHFCNNPDDSRIELIRTNSIAELPTRSADLIVSAFALHWSNDIKSAFAHIKQALRPDGLFLGVLPGPDTLKELRHCFTLAEADLFGGISPRIDPFVTLQNAGSLLQHAGFTLPVVDTESIIVRYDTAIDLMHDLRAMAATNVLVAREKHRFSSKLFSRVSELYAENHADPDGRIRATFELISLSGWAPHPDQPKPLKPGSIKTSLTEAIKNKV